MIVFLRERGLKKHSNGVMHKFTEQLNNHIAKEAARYGIPIIWWPSVVKASKKRGGKKGKKGNNGDKLVYVEKNYAGKLKKKGNFTYCIIAALEPAFTYATRELKNRKGEPYEKMYHCRKFVKHYYIYFHDQLFGGPCYLKLATYYPLPGRVLFPWPQHALAGP